MLRRRKLEIEGLVSCFDVWAYSSAPWKLLENDSWRCILQIIMIKILAVTDIQYLEQTRNERISFKIDEPLFIRAHRSESKAMFWLSLHWYFSCSIELREMIALCTLILEEVRMSPFSNVWGIVEYSREEHFESCFSINFRYLITDTLNMTRQLNFRFCAIYLYIKVKLYISNTR